MIFPRSSAREIMDDVSIHGEPLDAALRELTIINRWLGGDTTSRKGVQSMLRRIPATSAISILDAGAGGSDLVNALDGIHPAIRITSLDLNLGACRYSASIAPGLQVVQGSLLALPFKTGAFDLVHVALVLHHFSEPELRSILMDLSSLARRGIIINDLRRSAFAYIGIKALTALFSRSAMVRNDGPISVRRGFLRHELVRLCSTIPGMTITIRRTWAFRWCVCLMKAG